MRRALGAAAPTSRAGLLAALALAAACGAAACGAAACSAAPERSPRPAAPRAAAPAAPPPPSPARYVLTEGAGVLLDGAGADGDGSPDPRPEPALYEGLRVRLEGGVVLAAAPAPEPLRGFRSIPARLGGGFVLWSDGRVYRAREFLGELAPIADVGAPGGARPYLASILLRSDRGLLEVDPATLSVRRFGVAGVADAVALDARRAARLDMVGRATVTLDGGASWIDVLEARGLATAMLSEASGAVALLAPSGGPALHVTAAGLVPAPPAPPRDAPPASLHLPPAPDPLGDASARRARAPEVVALAAATGALLPGGRVLVARDGDLAVLAAATARPLDEAAIAGLDPRYARCQPFRAGDGVLLACAHEAAQVLRLETTLSAPTLEATFPSRGLDPDPLAPPPAAFLGDDRGRLAFAGPCGSTPPGLHDFPERPAEAAPDDDDRSPWTAARPPPPRREPGEDQAARVCVRVGDGHWVERWIEGDDARGLYRWIPGERGAVTALVLGPRARRSERRAARSSEGVRMIHARGDDPALRGGLFPALADPAASPRLVDTDFWEDDDGAVRGWIHLPDAADAGAPAGGAPPGLDEPARDASPAAAAPPLSRRRGGRVAGVRVGADGAVAVFALPDAVAHVVVGGRFALAATAADPPAFFESTDGGSSWRPVEAPPARGIEPPLDAGTPFACSSIGCAMGDQGLVRLGWGGPPPPPRRAPPPYTPAASPAPPAAPPPLLSCRLDDDPPSFAPAAAPRRPASFPHAAAPGAPAAIRPPDAAPPVISLWTSPSSPLGAPRDGALSARVLLPFAGAAAPRRLSIRGASLADPTGAVVPVLLGPGAAAPVDLLLLFRGPPGRRARAGAAAPALLPFEHAGAIAATGELPGGDLLAFDAGKRTLLLAGRHGTLEIAGLAPVSGVAGARLTLARRLDAPGFAVAGYSVASGEVFAGPLDVERGQVGPLEPLGSLASLAEIGPEGCGGARPSYRFLAELPATLRVASRSGAPLLEEDAPATALLAGGRGALCVEAIELRAVAAGASAPSDLSAVLGPGGAAALRPREGGGARLRCSLLPDRP
ncbi:hypothetical protein [Sorangium sp. So ce131]|uniref:hypothetical protein n=1 Tax=Sorangium sp. So ce131 TaxID=3133282 RepID=UPI003F6163FC